MECDGVVRDGIICVFERGVVNVRASHQKRVEAISLGFVAVIVVVLADVAAAADAACCPFFCRMCSFCGI